MYEFGCFIAFWSNFELMLEVAIYEFSDGPAKANCLEWNPQSAGRKKEKLEKLLAHSPEKNKPKLAALKKVFDVAERNDWIHAHILNPNGDFSVLTRFRVEKYRNSLKVSNARIDFNKDLFSDFYDAYGDFEKVFNLPRSRCDAYILELQEP